MNPGIKGFPTQTMTEQRFYANGAGGAVGLTKNWHQYQVPDGAQFISFFLLGSGAGGGQGFTGVAASARGGGGGGGSGAMVRATFLVSMLPTRNLWLQVPRGGSSNTNGGRALVAVTRSVTAADLLLISGAADAGSGANGTVAGGGAAGAASTVAAITTASLAALAIDWSAQVGIAGGAGGAHTGAAGAAVAMTIPVSGGAGGGGVTAADFAGGAVTGVGSVNNARPTIAGGVAGSNPGNGGLNYFNGAFLHSGGSGGGSANSAAGGRGGDGGLGSGGGGGGGGTTGGGGGTGGGGIIIITTW